MFINRSLHQAVRVDISDLYLYNSLCGIRKLGSLDRASGYNLGLSCGRGSAVEYWLPKPRIASSNLVVRSI